MIVSLPVSLSVDEPVSLSILHAVKAPRSTSASSCIPEALFCHASLLLCSGPTRPHHRAAQPSKGAQTRMRRPLIQSPVLPPLPPSLDMLLSSVLSVQACTTRPWSSRAGQISMPTRAMASRRRLMTWQRHRMGPGSAYHQLSWRGSSWRRCAGGQCGFIIMGQEHRPGTAPAAVYADSMEANVCTPTM